jgi:hypothetical protein
MDNFDISYLQTKSVQIVQDFLSGKGSLDELVADTAQADSLSQEQLKRLVESVNTLAFLKTLQANEDRTKEFPVCSFDKVISIIMNHSPVVKEAAVQERNVVKYKSIAKRRRLAAEQEAMLKKAFFKTYQEVERDMGQFVDYSQKTASLREVLLKEPFLLEKLASVSATPDFIEFCGGNLEKTAGYGSTYLKEEEVKAFQRKYDFYKEASEAMEDYLTKLKFLETCLDKQANLFTSIGSGVRKGIWAATKKVGSMGVNGLKGANSSLKNYVATGKYAKANGFTRDEATTHLKAPENVNVAKRAGVDPVALNKPSVFKKAGTGLNVLFAASAAKEMQHNPNTNIKNI